MPTGYDVQAAMINDLPALAAPELSYRVEISRWRREKCTQMGTMSSTATPTSGAKRDGNSAR